MNSGGQKQHLRVWAPATYRIVVEGHLKDRWSDRFAGMLISSRKRDDESYVTTLVGRVRDQAELAGILERLNELHFAILKVEYIRENGFDGEGSYA